MGAKRTRLVPTEVLGPTVVAHPGFRKIPACVFKLETGPATKRYDDLARMLYAAGKLTVEAHYHLSSAMKQFDVINRAETSGEMKLRGSWFAEMNRSLRKLKLDDLDKPIAAPPEAAPNKFSRNGFSAGR